MKIFVVSVEKRLYCTGTIEIEAENADAAQELIEEKIKTGELQTTNVNWDDPQYEDCTFNYLEDWCRDNNLSYIRESSACGEYSAEIVWWIPGMEKPQVVYCTEDQEPYIYQRLLGIVSGS